MLQAYREGLNDIPLRKTSEITRLKERIKRLLLHQQKLNLSLQKKHQNRIQTILTRVEEQLLLHKNQLKSVDDGELLHEYLLDSVPFLIEYESAANKREHSHCENITLEFQEKMNMPAPSQDRLKSYKRRKMTYDPYVCRSCNSRNTVKLTQEAALVCEDCSCSTNYGILDGIASLSYEQKSQLPGPQYTYKPAQHFIDLLNQVEGISTRSIPGELFTCLENKFKQFGVKPEDITPADVRSMLRDVQLVRGESVTQGCKFYEDVFFLTKQLNPTFVPIKIPEERKIIFKSMFREVYSRFHKNALKINPKRKNFLSYPFTAYKFSEHNGWREYMPLFSLLKSREKLRTQDMILKLIFNELNWCWRDTV